MSAASVVLLAAIAVSAGGFLAVVARSGLPVRPAIAPARGSAAAGVRYALTTAFLPWAKESARRHLLSYAAGIVLHLAIFAALARLVASLVPGLWPSAADPALAAVLAAGLACGLGLLVKRGRDVALRAVSTPEDVAVNLLVDLTLALGIAAALAPGALPAFQLAGTAVLLYAPLGKLRHMVFLFLSRRFWGVFFGRRGVRPAPPRAVRRRG